MNSFFVDTFGESIGPVMGLAATILVIAIALWLAWLVLKRFRNGLFVSGGSKGRMPRLAVIDAVPVDSHRRMILVRRDDVEHLIMIGGPTDIVVETGISKAAAMPAQPATLPQTPRLPVQNTQPQTGITQPQRTANVAARDAVTEAERGRPVRSPESFASDRRGEQSVSVNQPAVGASPNAARTPIASVAPAAPVLPAAPMPTTAGRTPPPFATEPPAQPANNQSAAARSQNDFDMDSLISDLKFNPAKDR